MSTNVALDLGSNSFKAVKVEATKSGYRVLSVAECATPAERDPDAPIFRADGSLSEEMTRAILGEMRAKKIPTKGLIAGLSGRDSILRYTRTPPIPRQKLELLMSHELGEMTQRGEQRFLAGWQVMNIPVMLTPDLVVMIGLAKEDQVENRRKSLQTAELQVAGFCPSTIALFNALALSGRYDENEIILGIDIGAANTNLVIFSGKNMIFARALSFGGDNFTSEIEDAESLTHTEAEERKLAEGNLDEGPFAELMQDPAQQLFQQSNASVGYCRNQIKLDAFSLNRVVITGGGAKLAGLSAFLAQKFKLPVELFDPLGDEEGKTAHLTNAVGLALSKCSELGAYGLELVSDEVLKKRRLKRDLLAYVGVVALNLGVFAFAYNASDRLSQAKSLHEGLEQVKTERANAEEQIEQAQQIKKKAEEDLRSYCGPIEENNAILQILKRIGDDRACFPKMSLTSIMLRRDQGKPTQVQVMGYVDRTAENMVASFRSQMLADEDVNYTYKESRTEFIMQIQLKKWVEKNRGKSSDDAEKTVQKNKTEEAKQP